MVSVTHLTTDLAAIVGDEHVVTDAAACERLSQDLSLEPFALADAVVAPGSADEVAAVLAHARERGLAIAVRAGGMSYTRSHVPTRAGTVLLDIRRLDAILDCNPRDGHVTVQAGCRWETLYLALREHGVRTPFWGPLSGRVATVGGALSQHALFLGFAGHGVSSRSVLGLDVVLADGTRVRTGSGAHRDAAPFWRDFGPDLTGLFLGDSGAFGVKVAATLRLIPTPRVAVGVSFACEHVDGLLATLEAAARTGVCSDLYGFDGPFNALLSGAGFSHLRGTPYSVHALIEAPAEAIAQASLELVRREAGEHAREIQASLPLSIIADPFGSMRAIFRTQRPAVHLPTNAIVPWSSAAAAMEIHAEAFREHAAALERHGIETWTLFAASPGAFNIEPALVLDDDLGRASRSPAAREAALAIRHDLSRRFDRLGAMHVQIGKYYDFLPKLLPGTRDLLERLKATVDPDGTLAPGALGLGEP